MFDAEEDDYIYDGNNDIDWFDQANRLLLVKNLGWLYDACIAKEYYGWWEEDV